MLASSPLPLGKGLSQMEQDHQIKTNFEREEGDFGDAVLVQEKIDAAVEAQTKREPTSNRAEHATECPPTREGLEE
jgi:hypothetical protein